MVENDRLRPENRQASRMKTTFDLPSDLNETSAFPGATGEKPRVRVDIQANGLPIVRCAQNAPASRMSEAELIALESEARTRDDLERLGLSV